MKVSSRVHYGLRAMTELARSFGADRLVSISEIARSEDLPLAYLEQLVGELRRAGLVEGTRGVRGGYRLARPPSAITELDGVKVVVDPLSAQYVEGAEVDYVEGLMGRGFTVMNPTLQAQSGGGCGGGCSCGH